jgi:hypothetical protein
MEPICKGHNSQIDVVVRSRGTANHDASKDTVAILNAVVRVIPVVIRKKLGVILENNSTMNCHTALLARCRSVYLVAQADTL